MPPEGTLLPPPPSAYDDDDLDERGPRASSRTLESVGAVAVLGAMIEQRIEQRRKSQPFLDAFEEASELAEEAPETEHRVVTRSGVQTQEVRRPSVGFLKVR